MNKNHWDRKVLDLMENIKLVPNVAFRYVNEIRKLVSAIKLGWRWLDRVMQYKKAWEREEVEEKLTPTGKRANELKKIYENVHKELKFQTSEDFESKTLLTLIYQCWLSRGQFLYSLYKFFMKSMAVIMKSLALGENIKVAALPQEVIFLSKNTSELVDMKTRCEIFDSFKRGFSSRAMVMSTITNGRTGYERIRLSSHQDIGSVMWRLASL